jgi:lipoprotein-releasing system permease protein
MRRYELFIAFRYLRARRRERVLSLITSISMLGIMVGVWALVVVLAFQSGMEQDLQGKILAGTAHINLLREDEQQIDNVAAIVTRLEKLPQITAAAATAYLTVLVSSPQISRTAVLKSVDLQAPPAANELYQTIKQGTVQALAADAQGEYGVILGQELARDLGVKPGDVITALSPEGRLTPAGLAPRQQGFKVVGIFQSGLYDYDANWGYIAAAAVATLVPSSTTSQIIQLKVDDIFAVKQIGAAILADLGPGYKIKDWQQLNQPVFAALNLQRLGFFLGISLIILVAALNIVTTLIMMVSDKTRDIAILRSLGAERRSILRIFMLQGLFIGLVGLVLGGGSGVITAWLANKYQLITLDPKIYSIAYVPFQLQAHDVLLVTATALIISFLATIYPAKRAAALLPVDSLRYE